MRERRIGHSDHRIEIVVGGERSIKIEPPHYATAAVVAVGLALYESPDVNVTVAHREYAAVTRSVRVNRDRYPALAGTVNTRTQHRLIIKDVTEDIGDAILGARRCVDRIRGAA